MHVGGLWEEAGEPLENPGDSAERGEPSENSSD